MIGSYEVRISRRRRASYKFTIKRNITIIRGDSGSGKTTLYDMINDYARLGAQSGVSLQCDRPCVALSDSDWRHQLESTSESIVFVDEGLRDVLSPEFASAVKRSSNYFVLITRADLANLPYSVDEIYKIKTSGKYHTLEPFYKHNKTHRHYLRYFAKPKKSFDAILTEDAKSGHQFFCARFGEKLTCASAGGNANILRWLLDHPESHVFVVADGAAFGAYADRVLRLQQERRDSIAVCLPESFEWLLLRSGLIKANGIDEALDNPSGHIDCQYYESWEQFFTQLLTEKTAGTIFEYKKSKLSEAYMIPKNADKVMALIACGNIQ